MLQQLIKVLNEKNISHLKMMVLINRGVLMVRIYHGQKVSKGRHSIRRQRYSIRPGNVVLFNGQKYISKGCGSYGTQVLLDIGKSVSIKKVQIIRHTGGWINLNI